MTALFAAQVEQVEVAERELLQKAEELRVTREAIDSTRGYVWRLFDEAPVPYVVTDVCGIIKQANRAAAVLLKRPEATLELISLTTFVPLDRRNAFREGINRLPLVGMANDWRVQLLRHGDSPIDAAIDVSVCRGGREGEDLLCWVIRPVGNS
jgi:PAS domain-containing protein